VKQAQFSIGEKREEPWPKFDLQHFAVVEEHHKSLKNYPNDGRRGAAVISPRDNWRCTQHRPAAGSATT
jgi:hypothetical protein